MGGCLLTVGVNEFPFFYILESAFLVYCFVFGYFLVFDPVSKEFINSADGKSHYKRYVITFFTGEGTMALTYLFLTQYGFIQDGTFMLYSLSFLVSLFIFTVLLVEMKNKIKVTLPVTRDTNQIEARRLLIAEKYSFGIFFFLIVLNVILRALFAADPSITRFFDTSLFLGYMGVSGAIIFIVALMFHFERKDAESKLHKQ